MNQELLKELARGGKSARMKRRTISHIIENGPTTITDLSKHLNCSIPTATKLINDLVASGTIREDGKLETQGGRYPILYGLVPEAGYFVGVDVKHSTVNIAITDSVGVLKNAYYDVPYILENTIEKKDELCTVILAHTAESGYKVKEVLNVNINLPGRIDPELGVSYNLFNFNPEEPLTASLSQRLGMPVTIDNDTRGMAWGEYVQGVGKNRRYKNVLYINFSWGLALGIILDGKVYYGKSGFSGEIGHSSAYDNQILCHCGKKGCLETEVSGLAIHRILIERIQNGESSILSSRVLAGESITQNDIIQAALQEDVLVLEILSDIGAKLGKQIAMLINLFNPEQVIIGGAFSRTGDYLTQSIQTVVRTYSLSLVNKDTKIVTAELSERAGVVGACALARTRRFRQS